MSMSSIASRQCRKVLNSRGNLLDPRSRAAAARRLFSDKPENKPPPTIQNMILAGSLFGFCGFVFTYSMRAVGRSDAESDPLAQLKAEAQEARESKQQNKRLSKEEIEALESGISADQYEKGTKLEVAVAAPADIAELEEQANLKVFSKKQGSDGEAPKKKPWWRFGF